MFHFCLFVFFFRAVDYIRISAGSRPWDRRVGEPGHPDPEIKGARSPKNVIRPFRPHFGLKIRGRPPGPSPGPVTVYCVDNSLFCRCFLEGGTPLFGLDDNVPLSRTWVLGSWSAESFTKVWRLDINCLYLWYQQFLTKKSNYLVLYAKQNKSAF